MNPETLKCLCGHLFRHHFMLTIDKNDNMEPVCGMCEDGNDWRHSFKLDNLVYLEMKSEKENI